MRLFEVLAHEGEEVVEAVQPSLDEVIRTNSIQYSLISTGVLFVLVILSILFKDKSEKLKYLFFGLMALIILGNTIYLSFSTIYLNQQSTTGGPVHWHADFEIYNCGKKVEIENPEGFSNKVGTEVVHEHNDDRIHIEGVILEKHDASIGHFIEALGGDLHEGHLSIPAEEGLLEMEDGQMCNGQVGALQVFVYRTAVAEQTKGDSFYQQKLTDEPQDYIISPFGQVPPGDCIIIEFDKEKEETDKLCTFYKLAVEKGELHD
ncbi:hypothetical protein HYS94_05675 [Candidatus Daviesbacteria bacterium]|nr:hypothetical protein [Candidatus Daviesbacteria bacterium]